MKIAIPKECHSGETRVAISPEVVKKYTGLGFDVVIESNAGTAASFTDDMYKEAGATISKDAVSTLKAGDVILKIMPPVGKEVSLMKKGAILVSSLSALTDPKGMEALAKKGVTAFAMELVPRITRAQSMDILSSQSNLAGYQSILEGANEFGRSFPMMMTAAGTIAPARVFIMGVGVAGLQAIATGKRLGGIVTATDVRPATREQVESLGGKFLEVDAEMEKDAQTEGGYAKEMPPEYFAKQKVVVAEHLTKQDIVVTTALIPGRPAPVLITEDMVAAMKPGSVIVDIAVESGGNCPLSKPGQVVVTKNGVRIVGTTNLPGKLAEDASALFSKNLFNFLSPFLNKETGKVEIDWEDEVIKGTLITRDGSVVNQRVLDAKPTPAKPAAKAKPKAAAKPKAKPKTAPVEKGDK